MKTKLPFLSKFPMLFAFGSLAVFVISCGSYQNSSYYDNDGVYGNYDRNDNEVINQYSEENLQKGIDIVEQSIKEVCEAESTIPSDDDYFDTVYQTAAK